MAHGSFDARRSHISSLAAEEVLLDVLVQGHVWLVFNIA
jgi:hypothetical protein